MAETASGRLVGKPIIGINPSVSDMLEVEVVIPRGEEGVVVPPTHPQKGVNKAPPMPEGAKDGLGVPFVFLLAAGPCFVVNAFAHLEEEAVGDISAPIIKLSHPAAASSATVADVLSAFLCPFLEWGGYGRCGFLQIHRSL
eukprot:scaffold7320_cov139-Isochrysis_galbana.AAC.9